MGLLLEAGVKFLLGLALMCLLLFLPAGGWAYPNAWLLLAVLFIPMFIAGLVMWKKAPELLRKRLQAKERQGTQQKVIAASGLMFFCGFIISALDWRFGWTTVSAWLVWIAVILFLIGYILFAEVLRENAYLSRTVEVQTDQKVIDTGLYGLVRHPMYFATLLMFLAMPLILGSWIGFAVFLAYPVVIRTRILNEETVLLKDLAGYREYCDRVRFHLIPYLW